MRGLLKNLSFNHYKTVVKIVEAATLVFVFTGFVHLLTSASVGLANIIVAAALVVCMAAAVCWHLVGDSDLRKLLAVLTALAIGFWVFSFFRYIGWLSWPLARPCSLSGYIRLLWYHLMMAIAVLIPVLAVAWQIRPVAKLRFGNWRAISSGSPGRALLLVILCVCWLCALYVVFSTRPQASGAIASLIVVCILKAVLTGATEEICYRGIIQPAAIARFGVPLGMILQSCLYAGFHMHLGMVFSPRPVFLVAVTVLGFVLGLVSYRTGGIGWAALIHIAINVVIEWRNIS